MVDNPVKTPLDVSIIIVNFNGGSVLRDCVASLFARTIGVKFAVTLFDNGSSDGSAERIKKEFGEVKLVHHIENVGFAKANNQAIAQSGAARYYLLLNPDTVLRSDAIKTMMDFMDANPNAGVCGPKVVLENGKLDAPCRRSFKTPAIYFYNTLGLSKLFPKSRRFGKYYFSYLDEDEGSEVDSVVGAFLMIRGETMREIGLLDESFFIYGEDEDWCFRAKQAGWKVFYNPNESVLHLKGTSTGKKSLTMSVHWHKAAYLFHRKHLAGSYGMLTNLIVYAGIALHLGVSLFFTTINLGKKRLHEIRFFHIQ
ncbi:MAG: glycosyltransferase family 2 protein [Actinobacteria bacterium]|nr:glycosyltransferase family 2 protein [Actinomycetota bacterium]